MEDDRVARGALTMGFFSRLLGRRPAKILVVEDSPDISELIEYALSAAGYEVTIAADGVEGFSCFRKEKFDLLILDYNMPRMGGAQLLELIRAEPEGRKTAVIMLSAERMLEPIYKAYDLGIVTWIPKPFEPADLLAKVAVQLKSALK